MQNTLHKYCMQTLENPHISLIVAFEILIRSLHTKGLIREWLNTFCTHEYMNESRMKHGSHFSFLYFKTISTVCCGAQCCSLWCVTLKRPLNIKLLKICIANRGAVCLRGEVGRGGCLFVWFCFVFLISDYIWTNVRDSEAPSFGANLIRCPMVRCGPDYQKSATCCLSKLNTGDLL